MINTKTGKQRTRSVSKMQRTQILLDPDQYKQLVDLAHKEKQSMSGVLRQMVDEALRAQKRRAMEKAAEMMAGFYEADKELTAFLDLDGEDFIA
jgi:predicted CopG family antitoxin